MLPGTKIALVLAACMFLAALTGARADTPPEIKFKLLYQLAQLSNEAYHSETEILGKLPGHNNWVATPGSTHVQYILLNLDDRRVHVIAVRGTVDDTNWDLNKDRRTVVDRKAGIPLHHGFRTAAATIYRDVRPRLKRGYKVYLTGHSLGGAVAAILGIYFHSDKVELGGIYTYGQPKFTTVSGARAYRDLPLLRMIYQNDAVAFVPDRTPGSGEPFAHIGSAINLLSGRHYALVPAEQAMAFSQGSLRKVLSQISLPDHRMRWYLKGLRDKLDGATRVPITERNKYIFRHRRGHGGQDDGGAVTRYNFNRAD